jgi:hypothetical protein
MNANTSSHQGLIASDWHTTLARRAMSAGEHFKVVRFQEPQLVYVGRRDRNGRDKQLRRSLRDLHYDKSRRPHRNIRRSTGSEHVQQFTPQDIPTHVPPSDSLRHENTAVNDHPPRENATTNDRPQHEDAAVRESQRHNDATTNHLRQRHVAFGEAHTTTIQAHYPDPVIRQPHGSFGTLRRHTTRCIDDNPAGLLEHSVVCFDKESPALTLAVPRLCDRVATRSDRARTCRM